MTNKRILAGGGGALSICTTVRTDPQWYDTLKNTSIHPDNSFRWYLDATRA